MPHDPNNPDCGWNMPLPAVKGCACSCGAPAHKPKIMYDDGVGLTEVCLVRPSDKQRYLDDIAVRRRWGQLGLLLLIVALVTFTTSFATEGPARIERMLVAIFTAVSGATLFLAGLLPLFISDVMYLRKKGEKEQGIY